jgi:hypothetical protein
MTTVTKLSPREVKAALDAHFTNDVDVAQRVSNLACRWQEERQYEDWADYTAILRGLLPADADFLKATKRPFGVHFTVAGYTVFYGVRGRYVMWRATGRA